MSLVDEMITLLSNMNEAAVRVDPTRCIAVRNRHAACQRCVESCTAGALAFEEGELRVDADACIGCGTCATACPTSAIEALLPTDDDLTAALKDSIRRTKGHPVIACSSAIEAHTVAFAKPGKTVAHDELAVVEVACLGRVDESVLIGAAAYRSFDVTLVRGHCENCGHATGGALCECVAESARGLLDAFGCDMGIALVDELPEHTRLAAPSRPLARESVGASRREALRAGGAAASRAAAQAAADAAAPVLGNQAAFYGRVDAQRGTLPQQVPTRRARLYNYLRRLNEPEEGVVRSRVIGHAVIDPDACTSCRMCAVFCPTGALLRVDEPETFGIAHRSSACVQCRLCESVCRTGAIHVEDEVPAKQFMGKQVVLYDMERPTWQPNKPDSMYNKFHSLIGEDLNMCMF